MLKRLKLLFGKRDLKEKFDYINELVEYLQKQKLYPPFPSITSGVNEPECCIDGEKYLIFCANNYLGLSENLSVKEAAIKAIEKYGIGPGGSRVISGNVDIIERLEVEIANLVGAEDCLTFPTGYMANVGIFKAVMDNFPITDFPFNTPRSVIFSDEFNHGSIVDGCRLSNAEKVIFKHNDLEDLDKKLKKYRNVNKLIVTEGVFSLDGEILELPQYGELARKHKAKIMIDDAHGVGLLGRNGGGTPEYHDCMRMVDINMGCMDKSMGGTGGYICGNKRLIDYLRISTRSSLLSSAIPCGMAGAIIESINIIQKERSLRDKLFDKAKYMRKQLSTLGFKILGKHNLPAIALYIGDEELGIEFSERLYQKKILSPVIRWPAVPMGESRFRIIVMATHKREHLDHCIEAFQEVGTHLGIISG